MFSKFLGNDKNIAEVIQGVQLLRANNVHPTQIKVKPEPKPKLPFEGELKMTPFLGGLCFEDKASMPGELDTFCVDYEALDDLYLGKPILFDTQKLSDAQVAQVENTVGNFLSAYVPQEEDSNLGKKNRPIILPNRKIPSGESSNSQPPRKAAEQKKMALELEQARRDHKQELQKTMSKTQKPALKRGEISVPPKPKIHDPLPPPKKDPPPGGARLGTHWGGTYAGDHRFVMPFRDPGMGESLSMGHYPFGHGGYFHMMEEYPMMPGYMRYYHHGPPYPYNRPNYPNWWR